MIHEDGSCIRILTLADTAKIMIGLLWHYRTDQRARSAIKHYSRVIRK